MSEFWPCQSMSHDGGPLLNMTFECLVFGLLTLTEAIAISAR